MPQSDRILELLGMPQQRNLKLTGERPPEACKRRADNKGLWKGCVVISSKARWQLRNRYTGCANCVYHGNQTFCTIRDDMPLALEVNPGGPQVESSDGDFDSTPLRRSRRSLPAQPSLAQDAHQPARSSAPVLVKATPNTENQVSSAQTDSREPGMLGASNPTTDPIYLGPQVYLPRQPQPAVVPPPTQSPSLVHRGALQSSDILEMETWEVTPGRIAETATMESENIAFSKSYVSTNHVVSVMDDVFFRVDTIYSGATLQIGPGEFKTRICSVALGKVRVRTGDEPEFTIGSHGMFKVKPGVGCTVLNWMYMDALLHITMLGGFI